MQKSRAAYLVTFILTASAIAAPIEYDNEAEFLADLAMLPDAQVYNEDFEGSPWDEFRFPLATSEVTVSGVTWSGNEPLSTNENWARTGFGLFTVYVPPVLTADEFYGSSERTMYAIGGYFDSNADFSDVVIEIDGIFGAEGLAFFPHQFIGVIDPDGFHSFRIHDPDQEHVLGADDFTIAIAPEPCLADLTQDGELNFFDVSAFLSAYTNGDQNADFTGDGTLNFFDVSAFLGAYNAGCP